MLDWIMVWLGRKRRWKLVKRDPALGDSRFTVTIGLSDTEWEWAERLVSQMVAAGYRVVAHPGGSTN